VTAEDDRKRIVRQWNREIEDETRRLDVRPDEGPWRKIVWAALWLGWLLLLGALLSLVRLHG
jgi:hypothetical protein